MTWPTSSPLAGPIFTVPKDPTSCGLCGKRGQWIKDINDGRHECSAWECPLRKKVTANNWPFPVVIKDKE